MNIVLAPFLLLPGVVVLGLVVGAILLIVKGGSAIRWFFGTLLLVITVVFLGLFSMRVPHPQPVSVQDADAAQQSELQGVNVYTDKDAAVWRNGLEEELVPDVYANLETAAYGLGIQLQDTMAALPHPPKRIIILENDPGDMVLLEQLRHGLEFILPESHVAITSQLSSQTQTEEDVRITLSRQQNPAGKIVIPAIQNVDMTQMSQVLNVGNQRGILQAIVQTTDNKFTKQVQYDYRPWLQNEETFRSQVGSGQWAVITSQETAITKEQARQQVIESAERYLAERLPAQNLIPSRIQQSDLRRNGFIVDEYYQRLQGISGPIWRAALLLDVSPGRVQLLRHAKAVAAQQTKRTWRYHIFSLVEMVTLISILYVFVNTITKGYYSTRILIISLLTISLFVLFLVLA